MPALQLRRFHKEYDGKQLPIFADFFRCVLTPVVFRFRICLIISCAALAGISFWRGVADVRAATGVPRLFVERSNLGRFQSLLETVFADYNGASFSSAVSALTVSSSSSSTCPGQLANDATCSGNGDCDQGTRVCACFSGWLGDDCSLKKVDRPVFSVSPRWIHHEQNLSTNTSNAVAEYVLFSYNEGDRGTSWVQHVRTTGSSTWLTVLPPSGYLPARGFGNSSSASHRTRQSVCRLT